MELIERYLSEVRRHLSYKNREDILNELRSALTDSLENQYGPNPTQEQVSATLKDFGAPQAVAARYHPEGQYLIGPALYPLFKMVTGIVIATILVVQIVVWLVTAVFGSQLTPPLEAAGSIFNSLILALGWLVITFTILQRLEFRPAEMEQAWDPVSLPALAENETVNRSEQVATIISSVVILSILAYFQGKVGVYLTIGGTFYENPVITQYLAWIGASLLVNIGLSVYLLWQGRWTKANRLAQVGANLLSIAVLALLVAGHQTWLHSHGVNDIQAGLDLLSTGNQGNLQVMMMIAFWFAFGLGLIASVVETGKTAYRWLRTLPLN